MDYINAEYDTSNLKLNFSNFISVPISQYCFDLVRNMIYKKIPEDMVTQELICSVYYERLFHDLRNIPECYKSMDYAFNYFYKDHFHWTHNERNRRDYQEIRLLQIFDTTLTEILQLSKLIMKDGNYYVLFPEESIPLLYEGVRNAGGSSSIQKYDSWLTFYYGSDYVVSSLEKIYPEINWDELQTTHFSIYDSYQYFFQKNIYQNQFYLPVVGRRKNK